MHHNWLLRVRPAILASALKRILGVKRELAQTSAGIFWVDPLSNFGNSILETQSYEPALEHVVRTLLESGDCFVDLGANEGYFSIMGSILVGEAGQVFSIEPQSRLQPIIIKNIELNSAHNVHLSQVAISDSSGRVEISLSPDMNTGSSGLARSTKYWVASEEVPQSTLESFLAEHFLVKVKLMKLDIEGYEYEAILGSRKVFEAGIIQHIALELHPSILAKRGKNETQIIDFLQYCGYSRNENYESFVMSKLDNPVT